MGWILHAKQHAPGTADMLKIISMFAGAEVEASAVMGKGFQIDQVPADKFPTVVIFATGTGISPIRSLIESGALNVGLPILPVISWLITPPCAFCHHHD